MNKGNSYVLMMTTESFFGLEIQGRWFNFQQEALELHFLQLVPVGS